MWRPHQCLSKYPYLEPTRTLQPWITTRRLPRVLFNKWPEYQALPSCYTNYRLPPKSNCNHLRSVHPRSILNIWSLWDKELTKTTSRRNLSSTSKLLLAHKYPSRLKLETAIIHIPHNIQIAFDSLGEPPRSQLSTPLESDYVMRRFVLFGFISRDFLLPFPMWLWET